MGKYIRILLAIVVVLGIVLLAKNQAAWAANSADQVKNSGLAVPLTQHDPCEKPNGMQGKDNHRCPAGSVRPPDDNIEICDRGNYSVGGIATLDINNLRGDGCLAAQTRDFDPALDQLPQGSGTILSDVIDLAFPAKGGVLKICFAVPPGEQAQIYSSSGGVWTPVKTNIKNGIACAQAKNSGDYTLVGR